MKSLIDYIIEKQIIGFGAANANYGQCIILAGGAASGKGHIQDKIDIVGRRFDVDDLKQKYLKLAKSGVFEDTYEYDLTNPEDTAKLHQKVKDRGWKSKEREGFWNTRKGKEVQKGIKADEKHSSKELPNVIFDMVSKTYKDVEEVVTQAKGNGYYVTLVWVVCNMESAKVSNIIRGIDRKGKARSVPESELEKGHKGAYETVTSILDNKYPVLNEFIDIAWLGFSSGWGRHVVGEHAENPVIKIKKTNNKFSWNKGEVDEFLKVQQPIDYSFLKKIAATGNVMTETEEWNLKKLAKFKQIAKDFEPEKLENAQAKDSNREAASNRFKTQQAKKHK